MANKLRIGFTGAGAISLYHLVGNARCAGGRDLRYRRSKGPRQGAGLQHSQRLHRFPHDDRARKSRRRGYRHAGRHACRPDPARRGCGIARVLPEAADTHGARGRSPDRRRRRTRALHGARELPFPAALRDDPRMVGPLEVVAAQVAKVNRELAGEDAAVVLLKGAGNLTAVLDGNISAPGYGPLPTDRVEIMGTRGTLVFDRDRLYMVGSDEPPVNFDLTKNYQVCFSAAVREFVNGIRTGRPFPTDRLDNLETLKLMEACYVASGVKV